MPRAEDGQYELVLENRQVLAIFFVAAVLCGVFFALGYIVGKNTGTASPSQAAAQTAASEGKESPLAPPVSTPAPASGSAGVPRASAVPPTTAANPTAAPPAAEKAAASRSPQPTPEPANPPEEAGTARARERKEAAASTVAGAGSGAAAQPAGNITVQVAALTKTEDAEAMVTLLRSKNFHASILSIPSDALFHVQVGPFASLAEAEAAKARLENEGFKPIIKKN